MISYVFYLIALSITTVATMFRWFNDARVGSTVSQIRGGGGGVHARPKSGHGYDASCNVHIIKKYGSTS